MQHLGTEQQRVAESTRKKVATEKVRRILLLTNMGQAGGSPNPSAWIRFITPFSHLGDDFELRLMGGDHWESAKALRGFDFCVVQRDAVPNMRIARKIVASFRKKLILDTDDDFLGIDESHSEFVAYAPKLAAHRWLASKASMTLVSTRELEKRYQNVSKVVYTIPNSIQPSLLQKVARVSHELPTRYLYFGTRTHTKDLDLLFGILDDRWNAGQRFTLSVVGSLGPGTYPSYVQKIDVPRSTVSYPHFLKFLASTGTYDAGFAPLEDNYFNRGKSDLKVLEYLGMGLQPVVSDVGPYREWISSKVAIEIGDYFKQVDTGVDFPPCSLEPSLSGPMKSRQVAETARTLRLLFA